MSENKDVKKYIQYHISVLNAADNKDTRGNKADSTSADVRECEHEQEVK